ncbi:hypothetical protein [Cellulomonas edaphi]|uniref:Neutral zinc metallopeptidase n=1 Tax=Cellulomonas edaphi TaxID=3053468 RepID=A0ABT7SA73_9CELL|nr:hypothetical protein [Cellulomons edaphi]MDM7832530.1 hypothetical protein [Cellulomons edaphi]
MLLTLTLIGFLTLAAVVSIRWVLRRVDALGRVRAFPKIRVGLCLALALSCAVPLWTQARLEGRLERAASAMVGAQVQVHCQTFGEAFVDLGQELGYVAWGPGGVPERATVIKRGPCADLRSWLASSKDAPSRDQVVAVHVLTHEAMHMAGLMVEAEAECAAVQRDAAMAVALGASAAQGRALAQEYWSTVYPAMPADYRGGCGPGGTYDERLATAPWQTGS